MRFTSLPIGTFVAGLVVLAAPATACAQDAGSYYQGRTIELIVVGAAGSDADIYGRLVARYLGKHIAGSPGVAVIDMPDRGGHGAADFIYFSAAKDGTAIAAVPADALVAPLWVGSAEAPPDPQEFVYLGSAASESTDCFVGGDAPIESFRDAFVREVTMGALADGGLVRGPALLNAMLGTRFHIVQKYAGVADLLTAIEKGEVMGACGLTWSSVSTRHPHWLLEGVLRGLVQESVSGSALATRLGIPLAADFAASAEDREVLTLAYAWQAFAQPFILPPKTLPAPTKILRKAFMDTLQDPDLLADAKAASLAIDPLPGPAIVKKVAALYDAPAQTVDRIRAVLAEVRAH